jgi:hypothetical protein
MTFQLLYIFFALISFYPILEHHRSLSGRVKISSYEVMGCALAAAIWPAVVVVQLFHRLLRN